MEQLVSAQYHESGSLTHDTFPSLPLTKSSLSVVIDKEEHENDFGACASRAWRIHNNYILTIVMCTKQICYPDLNYILWINYEYGLLLCLP